MDSFSWIMSLFQTMARAPKAPLTPLFILSFLRVIPSPSPPRRVLIPQRGRVSEPERDGDGGGLLMWRSAAAIATWGLLSFNQTKTWWRMCTARGNCRGFGGGGGRGQGRPVRKGARRMGRVAQGGSTEIHTSHSFLPLRHDKTKKKQKRAPCCTSLSLELGRWDRVGVSWKGRWVSSGTQKIKHLTLN